MRVVRALAVMEVRSVAFAGARAILAAETLLRGPSLDQRAVDGEVIVRHKLPGLLDHGGEELLRPLAVQQPVAVIREDRVVPYRIVHAETYKPAKHPVEVHLLDQLALARHGIKCLQQQRSKNVLGRGRGPTVGRVQTVEITAQQAKHLIRLLANLAQRMMLPNTLLQRYIAEHRTLKPLISTHNS